MHALDRQTDGREDGRTDDIPLKTTFFGIQFTRRMYRCIFNHFYVIGPKSYRIRRNNAKYTAITPFKVIQGHRFW